MRSTLLFCQNENPAIDPISYPCDIGRVADALLLYERIAVATTSFREAIGLIHWLGVPTALELMRTGVLSFVYLQCIPGPLAINRGALGLGLLHGASAHHPRREDPFLRSTDDLKRYLSSFFHTADYLPEGWRTTEELLNGVVHSTTLLPPEFPQRCLDFCRATLSSGTGKQLVRRAAAQFDEPSVLSEGIQVDDGCTLLVGPSKRTIAADGNLRAVSLVTENIAEAFAVRWLGVEEPLLAAGQEDLLLNRDERETAFSEICRLEAIPRLSDAVFLEGITGEEIVRLRQEEDARRLRAWLSSHETQDRRDDIVGAYLRSVGRMANRDSLTFSGLRVLGALAVGLFNPVAGAVLSVGDWVFTRSYFREAWNPRVFVDQSLRPVVPQMQAHRRKISIPLDVAPWLEAGWRLKSFHAHVDAIEVELQRHPNETAHWTYGVDGRNLAAVNRRIDSLIQTALCGVIYLDCPTCNTTNRVTTNRSSAMGAVCGRCRCRLVPLDRPVAPD